MSHDKDISDIRSKLVKKNTGSIHPINQTKYEIFDLLSNMGFKIISVVINYFVITWRRAN